MPAPDRATVHALLTAAKLPATAAETERFTAEFAGLRAGLDALYEVPEARYVDPVLRFRAAAEPLADWAAPDGAA